jgi:hypothetical protein
VQTIFHSLNYPTETINSCKSHSMIINKDQLWPVDKSGVANLTIAVNGTRAQAAMVRSAAREWETASAHRVKFSFNTLSNWSKSNVRIKFNRYGGWTTHKIGKAATNIDSSKPTVDMEWLPSDRKMMKRHILHELGHVLGAEHEQFSREFKKKYDFIDDKVIAYLKKNGNSDAEAKRKLKRDYRRSLKGHFYYSDFDPKSIMMYEIDKEFLRGKNGNVPRKFDWNYHLSPTDGTSMAKEYADLSNKPKGGTKGTAGTGTKGTGTKGTRTKGTGTKGTGTKGTGTKGTGTKGTGTKGTGTKGTGTKGTGTKGTGTKGTGTKGTGTKGTGTKGTGTKGTRTKGTGTKGTGTKGTRTKGTGTKGTGTKGTGTKGTGTKVPGTKGKGGLNGKRRSNNRGSNFRRRGVGGGIKGGRGGRRTYHYGHEYPYGQVNPYQGGYQGLNEYQATNYTSTYSVPYQQPATSNLCGNPSCGQTFICTADYNRQVQAMGYPGVTAASTGGGAGGWNGWYGCWRPC